MARAGQRVLRDEGGLGDRISVGVLASAFPREAVEEVVAAAGAREQRSRMLPAWLTVYFVLGLALFMDMSAGRVMRKLAGTLAWADAERLINTKLPARYDAAVTLLRDLQELTQHEDQAQAFARRFTALREAHLRKPSLIARFDRAGLTL